MAGMEQRMRTEAASNARLVGRAVKLMVLMTLSIASNPTSEAQTFTVLHMFTRQADGGTPYGSLLRTGAGDLYGTTAMGGQYDRGTVFKLDQDDNETLLYSFTGEADGDLPYFGRLTRDGTGNFYGTTLGGGANGLGTVFKITKKGHQSVLYSFKAPPDGNSAISSVIRDSAGNLYGVTSRGGDYICDPSLGCGTVFKIDIAGKEKILHRFHGGTDGALPVGSLVLDKKGNVYGTTSIGGIGNCFQGCGTVFKISSTGKERVLYSFLGDTDGSGPGAGLVRDSAGNLYGTTYLGGALGWGAVFKLDRNGQETILHSFANGPTDGALPDAQLVRDKAGNLYGTTVSGGNGYVGTIFRVDTSGQESVLHSFSYFSDGAEPYSGLVLDSAGALYGTTSEGGNQNCACGTVFKLTP